MYGQHIRKEILGKELGIHTYRDLLEYFPYKYIDRTKLYLISELSQDMPFVQIKGRILSFEETEMTVFVDNPQIRFKTRFTNTAKDHRVRLLVKTHNTRPSNDSESIYEVVTRPNKPAACWCCGFSGFSQEAAGLFGLVTTS